MLIPHLEGSGFLTRLNSGRNPGEARVVELQGAATRLLRESRQLREAGSHHGAIYLAGYTAEITLGYAYAKFSRADPNAPSHAGDESESSEFCRAVAYLYDNQKLLWR